MGNKKSKNKKEDIKSPKFELVKSFDQRSSIYYGFELKDGRFLFCIGGDSFDIYNINDLNNIKKDIKIYPPSYTVSCTQTKNGNIVVCCYVKDMVIYSIKENTEEKIQTISANRIEKISFQNYQMGN